MAKAKASTDPILDGLRKALTGPKLLQGTGGLFPAGAKGAPLAEQAVREGYLTKREELIAGGKGKPKPVIYGVITERGIQKVLSADSPKAQLEALLPAVQSLGRAPATPDPQQFRDELERATTMCVGAIRDAFASLTQSVMKAVTPSDNHTTDPAPILSALHAAIERVEAPVINTIPPPPAAKAAGPNPSELQNTIVSFVEGWVREKSVGCQFDVLMKHLRQSHPDITIGAFHDSLRTLHESQRIRFGGWPRMLDDLPEPELALFVSSKVMYYAQPAR